MLSDVEIKEELKKGTLKIEPLSNDQIGSASVDLTLSDRFWIVKKKYRDKLIDLSEISFKEAYKKIKTKEIIIKRGDLVLGLTKEKITMPKNLLGILQGRSRYARMGLAVHVTSSLVMPGSNNRQVLEIYNNAPFDIKIKEGMRISQIIFLRLNKPTSKPYSKYGTIAVRQ